MSKVITEEQKSLNNEKEFSLDEYRRSMPYWQRVSYSFSSLRWIVMQQKKAIDLFVKEGFPDFANAFRNIKCILVCGDK